MKKKNNRKPTNVISIFKQAHKDGLTKEEILAKSTAPDRNSFYKTMTARAGVAAKEEQLQEKQARLNKKINKLHKREAKMAKKAGKLSDKLKAAEAEVQATDNEWKEIEELLNKDVEALENGKANEALFKATNTTDDEAPQELKKADDEKAA